MTGGTITGDLRVRGNFIVGDVVVAMDANGRLHISKGVVSDGDLAAFGAEESEGGGSGGLDITRLWEELGTDDSSKVIDVSHIPGSVVLQDELTEILDDYPLTTEMNTALGGKADKNWVEEELAKYLLLTGGKISGDLEVTGTLKIGDAVLSYADGRLHVSSSVTSDGDFVAFGDEEGSTGSGGLDVARLWEELKAEDASKVIDVSHIPGSVVLQDELTEILDDYPLITEMNTALTGKADKDWVEEELAKYLLLTGGKISGDLEVTGTLKIGDAVLSYADGRLHVSSTVTSDGDFVAYGDTEGSGSGGGLDVDRLWTELRAADSSKVIDVSHIPNISKAKISDLPSWIGSTKPSYTWSEISNKPDTATRWPKFVEITNLPSTLAGYSITDGVNAVNMTGIGNVVTAASVNGHTLTLTKGITALTSVSLATISDLSSSWNALLKAAPSAYVTRWPKFSEVAERPSSLAGFGITDGVNSVVVSGTGNAVTSAAVSGHALTLTKGSTFVDLSSVQSVSGVKTFSNGIKIGTVILTDTGGRLHISASATSDGDFVAYGDTEGSGSGGGLDVDRLWTELRAADSSKVINITHIPAIPTSKITGLDSSLSSYAKKDGSNASGTWPISISGNAATADVSNYLFLNPNNGTHASQNDAVPANGRFAIYDVNTATTAGGNDGYIMAFRWPSGNFATQVFLDADSTGIMALRHRSSSNVWTDWYRILHSGNIGSYALTPSNYASTLDSRYVNISGDTMTGTLNISSSSEALIRYQISGSNKAASGYLASQGAYLYSWPAGKYLHITDSGLLLFGSSTVWHSGNDGSGSGIDADLLDGNHASRYTRCQGASNYVTFTVGGDANTYYPVQIHSVSDYYPSTLVNITRRYYETAPNTWNTASHRGGLTLCILWNNSVYWDGNGAGDPFQRVLECVQTYSTMVGGLDTSHYNGGGMVVWLRGGGAVYHAYSDQGTELSVSVYLSSFTDSANRTFSPRTTPMSIDRWKQLDINVASASKLQTSRTIWGRSFNGEGNVSGDMAGVGSISMSGSISGFSSLLSAAGSGNRRTSIDSTDFALVAATTGWAMGLKVMTNSRDENLGWVAGAYGSGDSISYYYFYGGEYTSPAMVIKPSSGNVGIGTTYPVYKLDVAGTLRATGQGTFDTIKITDNTSAAHLSFGRTDNFNYISLPGNGSTLAVAPGGTISGAGSALCISNSATYPGYHNGTISLGTSSYRWSNVYSVLGSFSGLLTADSIAVTDKLYIPSPDGNQRYYIKFE